MKTSTGNNPFIPSTLALSLIACGLMLPAMVSAAYVVKPVKRAPIVRQSVNAPQLLVHLRNNARISQPLMLALDKLAGTPLHVSRAAGPGEYLLFTSKPVSLQALQAIAARLRQNSNVLSANVMESSAPQYLITQSRQHVVLKGAGLIKSSAPIVHYYWRQIAGAPLHINDASSPSLSTTPTADPSTTTTQPVADPTGINPGDLFKGLFPTNIQPCSSASTSSTPADASTTPGDGSTPSGSTPAPVGPTFAFSGSFSSSYANRNPDGSLKTGTFATSFSGAWSTDQNGFFCSLNTDPNAGATTPANPGDNTSTTPVDGSTPGTTDTSGSTGATPGTTDTSGSTGAAPGTTDTSGSTGLANPTAGQPAAAGAPLPVDPNTGAYIDPATGQDMSTDPTTGFPMNSAGQDIDPTTGQPVASASPITASSVRATRAYIQKHSILGFRLLAVDRAGIVHSRNIYIHVKPASVKPAAKPAVRPLVQAKPAAKGRPLSPLGKAAAQKPVIKR